MTVRRSLRRSLLAVGVALLAACRADPSTAPVDAPDELTALPRPLTAEERVVVDASNDFAFDLLRAVADSSPGESVFLSPLSAHMALGMTANGAANGTRTEMLDVLGFDGQPMNGVNASYRSVIDLLRGLDRSVDFRLANSIWYRPDFPFSQDFLNVGRDVFDATLEPVSFADPATRTRINQWVDQATAGKITNMIEWIDPEYTAMILLNAIYFKGSWRERFDPARTRDATFESATGPQQVRMMSSEAEFPARFTPSYAAVELPYGAGAFAMTLIVPHPGRTAGEVLAELTPATLAEVAESEGRASVEMPKFRLEYKKVLNGTLAALGMPSAFDWTVADFTVMSPTRGLELYITEVMQKTFLDVNEEGTEAAAATSVTIGLESGPAVVRADRPFIFAIRERLSGTIMFVGVIHRVP